MLSKRADKQERGRQGCARMPFQRRLVGRPLLLQAGIAALTALSVLAAGMVSAADVCKLSMCWFDQQAKNDYECSEGCYFEVDPLDASPAAICEGLTVHEGNVPHMYRDTAVEKCTGGCITIGIGNMLGTVEDAVALQGMFMITDANGQQREATEQEIRDEFNNLRNQPAEGCPGDGCQPATHWQDLTRLTLSADDRSTLCHRRVDNEFIRGLERIYGADAWQNMPSRVQYAVLDMIYSMGEGALRDGWPRFNTAISNEDWATAAAQSRRTGQGMDARNAYVRGLLEAAAADKQTGTERLARCSLLP